MRSVEAILSDTNESSTKSDRLFPRLVNNVGQHIIELDLDALEQAGKWGTARVNIAGKTYQLFPVEMA